MTSSRRGGNRMDLAAIDMGWDQLGRAIVGDDEEEAIPPSCYHCGTKGKPLDRTGGVPICKRCRKWVLYLQRTKR